VSGFPNRPSLSSLGPTLVDTSPVRDPRKQVGADLMNLLRWQVAGLSAISPRAIILATVDPSGGGSATTVAQRLAWDADGAVPLATWVYSAVGNYTWTLSAGSYPDKDGDTIALAWVLMVALPIGVSQGTGKPLCMWTQTPAGGVLLPASGEVQLARGEDASTPDDPDQGVAVLLW
jgi:hypothetical protein